MGLIDKNGIPVMMVPKAMMPFNLTYEGFMMPDTHTEEMDISEALERLETFRRASPSLEPFSNNRTPQDK